MFWIQQGDIQLLGELRLEVGGELALMYKRRQFRVLLRRDI